MEKEKLNTQQEYPGQCLDQVLREFLNDDALTASEVSGRFLKMKRIREIEQKYQNKIKTRKDGRQYYIYISRKQYTAKSYDELITRLYELEYGRMRATLADLYQEWMVWRRDFTSVSSKTLKEYTYIWNTFLAQDAIKDISLADLKSRDFLHLFRTWTKDRAITKKRFGNVKSLLNGIYKYAIEQEIVEHNPIREINCSQFTFKPVNNAQDVFTAEERQKLLEHLENNDNIYALAIQLDFHLVFRIGELLVLKWTDMEGDFIHIPLLL